MSKSEYAKNIQRGKSMKLVPIDIITIYSDGGARPNTGLGKGGYGCVIIEPDVEWHLSGAENKTTNNRMEMKAMMLALRFSRPSKKYIVHTDSKYVINCAQKIWGRHKNVDLWKEYDNIAQGKVIEWVWIKGHSGNKYNEICDQLCTKEILELT
jgi:ribonuclease HI